MKNLKTLSNIQLFETTKDLVRDEEHATLAVLHALQEIERRRAFAEKSYPSLFEFCVNYLGYKKGAAYRRILAMRALKELPEIESKIQEGSLSLMTLSQAQGYFVQQARASQPVTKQDKLELIKTLENKSSRQTEELFLKLSPREVVAEKIEPVDENSFVLHLKMPAETKNKLEKLKSLMAAEKSGTTTLEVVDRAFDLAIQYYEKKQEKSVQIAQGKASQKAQIIKNRSFPKSEFFQQQKFSGNLQSHQKVPALAMLFG
jgi:hypothetical protein